MFVRYLHYLADDPDILGLELNHGKMSANISLNAI